MILGNSKQLFLRNSRFQEKLGPEMHTVDFVESKQVTFVQTFIFFVCQCINLETRIEILKPSVCFILVFKYENDQERRH